jgi:hypothetical protein
MPTHELSVNILAHLLSPTTRNVFLLTLASQIIGAKSPLESTLELTNRICDRYFPTSVPNS